jgi:hypothetical protein
MAPPVLEEKLSERVIMSNDQRTSLEGSSPSLSPQLP